MNQALWIAKTGLDAQQTRMSVISNNLANVNTTGFKQDRAVFEDLLYQTIRQPGAESSASTQLPSGLMLGTGVRTVATEKMHSQGNIVQSGNALDIAIQGRGFFQILMPDGSLSYTRDGTFQLDSTGQVVMSNGYPLEPAITIPDDAQSITVGSDGTVSVLQPGDNAPTIVGNIDLADFVNPTGLQAVGENLFKETGASGTVITDTPGLTGLGTLVGGALETSNVNVVTELINMIETQRAYEMNSKAISTADQMLQYASQNL
ncbi:flagellar basal-body rod protein FlgG [Methylophaga sp. OBS4]|uniref:flagellar basal-body rod protein FlgG n=1 Tax=Methylophaga sp. OBS4 TaxID=2991935 RepID=UPI00225B2CD5|nr:flagellar basal-body rod protein FlgG [Methylophaga sp. OBS4]MCX4187356.1 flagellar basal-body rod protein FlgG [Methylophaga sp. OBS4]